MCSIFGQVSFSNKLIDSKEFIKASDLMIHRGPDKKGYLSDNKTFQFAFNRLSILDLTDSGNQPMISDCKRYICLFNGEIYNYKKIFKEINNKFIWRGTSDTEVLLNAWSLWKENTLDKIDGMYSFAIWDTELETLFLARDRIGEKPLYFLKKNNSLIFSSRPNPIIEIFTDLKNKFENQSLSFYLSAGYFPRNKSFFQGIQKLEPGSYLKFNKNEFHTKKYWNINDYNPILKKNNSLNYYVDEFDNLLKESIVDRLSSDKPLGFFLSGGLDSSLIVAIASNILKKENIKVFNLGFDDKQYDESNDALLVTKHLGINIESKKLTPNQLLDLLPNFFEKFDEPFADPACFPLMAISKFAKEKVDVVVTGDGGDELFGGYNYYTIINILNKLGPSLELLNKIVSLTQIYKFSNHKLKLFNNLFKFNNSISKFAFMRSVKKDFSSVIINNELDNLSIENEFTKYASQMTSLNDPTNKCMRLDIINTLNDNYLQKTDLSTMAYSLECRSPFLSKDIVEWALKIPSKFKVNNFEKKIILKKLAEKYLPKQIINKKKQGFELPIKNWLRKDLKDWALNLINDDKNYTNLPLDKKKILALYELHISNERDCHPYLWSILMLLKYNQKSLNI